MDLPPHRELVSELKTLRERGLTRLRDTPLPSLEAVTGRLGLGGTHPDKREPADPYRLAAIEDLLHQAVTALGGGNLTRAAEYTFGLVPGIRDWPVGERRKRAAEIYGVSTERFRKHHEQLIVDQVSEAVLRLCVPAGGAARPEAAQGGPETVRLTGLWPACTLHIMPVELAADVDVIVSSENVYLEMSKLYRESLSGALRRAGARISDVGEVLDDTIQRELRDWTREHGRIGLPVAPGTVAATGAGELGAAGVRRIYHAAVAVPRSGRPEYEMTPQSVTRGVQSVFRLAAEERDRFSPPLRSIMFPLFGAGRCGLDPLESLGWLWAAVTRTAHAAGPSRFPWDLRLITNSRRHAAAVVAAFGEGPEDGPARWP